MTHRTKVAVEQVRATGTRSWQNSSDMMGGVRLRWLNLETREARETEQVFGPENLYGGFESASPRFRQDVLVARYAELLRFNSWDGDLSTSLEDLVSRVGNLRGDLSDRSFDQSPSSWNGPGGSPVRSSHERPKKGPREGKLEGGCPEPASSRVIRSSAARELHLASLQGALDSADIDS